MLNKSIPTREALVHSIPISEAKDMKSDVLQNGPSKLPSLNTNNSKNQHDGIISKNEGMMAGLALFPPHTRAPRERRGSMEQAIGRCRPTADPR
jgi:hypothetical protein